MARVPAHDFPFPLNVFVHVLAGDGGEAVNLHYGLFQHPDETITVAQERSTRMLLDRLPSPPARLLEVGIGLGTTLDRLRSMGHDVLGITPDAGQLAAARARFGSDLPVECVRFEDFSAPARFDAVLFQESAQYIEPEALFSRCARITSHVIVLDEFAFLPVRGPGALHPFAAFVAAAARYGYALTEEVDVSALAAPTPKYFLDRVEMYRDSLRLDLGVSDEQLDGLIASGRMYVERYRDGVYGYRVLQLRRAAVSTSLCASTEAPGGTTSPRRRRFSLWPW